jgi:MoxR-like ATPase
MSDEVKAVDEFIVKYNEFKNEIAKVIVGQEDIVQQVLISIFCNGHCLLVGVPGLAKTLLVQTIANSLGDLINLEELPHVRFYLS